MSEIKKIDEINENISWRDITPGGVAPWAGGAESFATGDWRTMRPVLIEDKCTGCLLCWPTCPDTSIIPTDDGKIKYDYDHCKGCGICVEVCPFDAIDFVEDIS